MNLNEIKNKITNISQQIDGLDLSGTSEEEFSVKNKVNLGMASIYPMYDNDIVTPHLAYLFNTRPVWNHYCNNSEIFRSPENYGNVPLYYKPENFKYSGNKLPNIRENIIPKVISKADTEYFSTNAIKIKQYVLSDLGLSGDMIIHKGKNLVVKTSPLRVETEQGATIGSSNDYIDFKGFMTILIYENKIVYIRLNGTEFKYKIYSYPNMSLINEGVAASLKDIYIKNRIYREGIVGPNNIMGEGFDTVSKTGGFIIKSVVDGTDILKNLYVIDLYNIIGPKYTLTGEKRKTHAIINYI
jgi:hypothetical protein